MRRSNVLLSCALLAAACGTDLPTSVEAGAPLIQTTSPLPDAVFDVDYVLQLEWSGGQEPFAFSIDVPRDLSWLTIDESQGTLTGRPDAVVNPGVDFSVTVTDAVGQSDTKRFLLAVAKCSSEGAKAPCFTFEKAAGRCLQGTALCSSGTFAVCESDGPSQDVFHCGGNAIGTSCGFCSDVTADRCDGTCKCGSSPPCSGDQPVCCGGQCVSSSGDDPTNCGGCGKTCPAGPANSSPTCLQATCGWTCNASYSKCGTSCVNLSNNVSHCGDCGRACEKPSGAFQNPTCSAGACRWYGKVTSSAGLNVRAGASSTSSDIGNVNWGATVTIDCLRHGQQINEGTPTDIWFHIIAGGSASGFITGAWTTLGSSIPNIPTC